jgi:hypothetical protein
MLGQNPAPRHCQQAVEIEMGFQMIGEAVKNPLDFRLEGDAAMAVAA